MTVRNQADADALNERIHRKLSVDISSYRNEEVNATLADLLIFPLYALNWVIRPVGLLLLLYLAGFFLIDLVHVQYLIYALVGLVLAVLTGLLLGLLYLTVRLGQDINAIMHYSTDILKRVVKDVDQLNEGTNATNRKETLTLLFAGVLHIITIPVTASIISNKIPFIGGLLSGLCTRVLRRMANLFRWPEVNYQQAVSDAGGEGNILPMYLNGVAALQSASQKVFHVAARVVQWPLLLVTLPVVLVDVFFVWLLH